MYIVNVTDDYDNNTSSNITDYDNLTFNNCTNSENNNIEIIIPLFTKILCSLSFICLISLMVNTLVKSFFNKK